MINTSGFAPRGFAPRDVIKSSITHPAEKNKFAKFVKICKKKKKKKRNANFLMPGDWMEALRPGIGRRQRTSQSSHAEYAATGHW